MSSVLFGFPIGVVFVSVCVFVCVYRRDKVVIISNPASVISEFIGDGLVLQMLHKFVSRTDENSAF